MYAGISGMKNFQTKLDVIGNNIANVNTVGFKKGRVTFQDMMSQTVNGAQGPTTSRGGVNPNQVGLGSQLGTIDNIHTQGFRQVTNNPLDFSIQGDGMFALVEADMSAIRQQLANPDNTDDLLTVNVDPNAEYFYTRAGNFYLDQDGYVVNADGLYLVAFEGADRTEPVLFRIPEDAQSFNVQRDGTVTIVRNGQPEDVATVGIANFSNPSGLLKDGSNLYLASESSGDREWMPADGPSQIIANSLEMSNVDLAEEFTEMITAQRGFQANTRIITTSDEILQELVNLKR